MTNLDRVHCTYPYTKSTSQDDGSFAEYQTCDLDCHDECLGGCNAPQAIVLVSCIQIFNQMRIRRNILKFISVIINILSGVGYAVRFPVRYIYVCH